MRKRIVIITDCSDIAYNELRGVILKNLGDKNQYVDIEPVVKVKPFSIINGNFILRLMADAYPPGTIFSAILNPTKKRPARIFGKTQKNNFIFIGANTGVFSWFLKDFRIKELYELNDPGFFPFGGKYVHAPNIAKLAMNTPFKEMGRVFNSKDLVELDIEEGTIIHIDNFGIIKFLGKLPDTIDGEKFEIKISNKIFTAIYTKRMMSNNTGEWVIYPGSSLGLRELGMVRKNGAKELGIKIGDNISFKKIK